MIMQRTITALPVRRFRSVPRSAVLRIGTAHDKMPMHKKKDRREPSTPFGPRDGFRPRVRAGPQCAIPFKRQDSLPMDHSTPNSPRKGTVVLRPSRANEQKAHYHTLTAIPAAELARGREVSR